MATLNRFFVLNEQEAATQLDALYRTKSLRTGATKTHRLWCVANHQARMAKASYVRNDKGQAMYLVEVR
ncbi:hypothetical protein A6D98_09790 [Aliivibrio fischeri]|uniref:Uncharacterized protein n=1 Tax=Aliivibrio phage vB_Alvi_H905 TaxID=3234039 RepID=A0AB39C9W1_9VIRU|nr:hypothetical protein [Aliivibrio fischeri]OCH60882.1 hypothetical protein A6D98_09790 [Aliivibrio fischeri]